MAGMIGLTNYQLKIVMNAARSIPVEKRDTFLQRIAAMLTVRGRGHFNDADVADITTLAIAGLIQTQKIMSALPPLVTLDAAHVCF